MRDNRGHAGSQVVMRDSRGLLGLHGKIKKCWGDQRGLKLPKAAPEERRRILSHALMQRGVRSTKDGFWGVQIRTEKTTTDSEHWRGELPVDS